MLPLINAVMAGPAANPVPVKHVMNQIGMTVGNVRLPLYDLNEAESEKLMAEVGKHTMDIQVLAAGR
jgi:dihydrodipicolinate synthase/N-acetylneuraminate lyase